MEPHGITYLINLAGFLLNTLMADGSMKVLFHLLANGGISVSYTHLDVYKRQSQYWVLSEVSRAGLIVLYTYLNTEKVGIIFLTLVFINHLIIRRIEEVILIVHMVLVYKITIQALLVD